MTATLYVCVCACVCVSGSVWLGTRVYIHEQFFSPLMLSGLLELEPPLTFLTSLLSGMSRAASCLCSTGLRGTGQTGPSWPPGVMEVSTCTESLFNAPAPAHLPWDSRDSADVTVLRSRPPSGNSQQVGVQGWEQTSPQRAVSVQDSKTMIQLTQGQQAFNYQPAPAIPHEVPVRSAAGRGPCILPFLCRRRLVFSIEALLTPFHACLV